jgi:hypothetical protein
MTELEALHEQVRRLEKSNRRWKTVSLSLGVLLGLCLLGSTVISVMTGVRLSAERAQVMRAMQEAQVERDRAEMLRQQAEQKAKAP